MKIQAINNQSFGAKKFRIPVKSMLVGDAESGFGKRKVNWVKEFSNPNAETLWNQALNETSMKKKLSLLEAMGEYKLIDLEQEKQIKKALKKMESFLNKKDK